MDHLTQQQVYALIDGVLDDAVERRYNAHLAVCARCRNEVALQRSLSRVSRELPLEKTSSQFTERTMNKILRGQSPSFSYRLLQHVGSAAAMLVVLVVLGYLLSSPSELFVGVEDSATSEVFTAWKTFYSNLNSTLASGTSRLSNAVAGTSSTPVSKIIVMTLLVLVGLAALDRFVLQKVARMKM